MAFEVIWHTLAVFSLLAVLTRILGKKLLSQIDYLDFVVGVTIGTITGSFVSSSIKGPLVLISPIVLTFSTLLMNWASIKSLTFRKLSEGESVIVIENGKIIEKNLNRLRYNLDQLGVQLREKDVFDIGQVEFAVLEANGKLSVLKKTSDQPVTRSDINISKGYQGLASEIIKDGKVIEENLSKNNLDMNWLKGELAKQGIDDPSKVFFASLQTDGSLYIDINADRDSDGPPNPTI